METFSALLAICAVNSPVPGEFPTQRPVTWSFDVFFDLRLNKRLSKQSRGWWFKTLPHPLWRHSNVKSDEGPPYTQKRKCHHFDEIFITGCTESCQNDNFQCRQWRKFRQNDDISVSVYIMIMAAIAVNETMLYWSTFFTVPSHEHNRLSDHRQLHCLFNILYKLTTKKPWHLHINDILQGNLDKLRCSTI